MGERRKTDSVLIFKRQIVLSRYPLYLSLSILEWLNGNAKAVHCISEMLEARLINLQQLWTWSPVVLNLGHAAQWSTVKTAACQHKVVRPRKRYPLTDTQTLPILQPSSSLPLKYAFIARISSYTCPLLLVTKTEALAVA